LRSPGGEGWYEDSPPSPWAAVAEMSFEDRPKGPI